MMDKVAYAHLRVSGGEAEFYLNGIPLACLKDGEITAQARAVEELLVGGENTLELLVAPGPTPSTARTGAEGKARSLDISRMECTASIARFQEGVPAEPARGDLLAQVTLVQPPAGTPCERTVPFSLVGRFTLREPRPRWAFQDAPVLTLDDTLREEARLAIEEFAAVFREASPERYVKLASIAIEEGIRAYHGWTIEGVKGEIAEVMQWHQQAGGKMCPIEPKAFDLRLVANGRLVQCTQRDRRAILRLIGPEQELQYGFFLGRKDGALRIMRF